MPRLSLAAACALVALLGASSTADAAVSIANLAAEPSALQAGGNPDLPLSADFTTADDDDLKDLTVSLAPGVLASVGAVAPGTQIGDGSVTLATGGGDVAATAKLTVEAPSGGLPRVGLDLEAGGQHVSSLAEVVIRQADGGVDLVFTSLARDLGGTAFFIRHIAVKINGTVASQPFTRNATACTAIKTKVSYTTYAVATASTAEDEFMPTGCDALAFSPTISGNAVITPGSDGVELTSTVSQPLGQAAQKTAVLQLPSAIAPRLSALARACTTADLNACPATATVGSASATTPLLPGTLSGKILLVANPIGLPFLTVLFPAPVPLRLNGTTQLTNNGPITTFSGIPDVPLTSLVVKLNGGADSVLQATSALCDPGQTIGATFTAHSGKTATVSSPLPVTGTCAPKGGGGGGGGGGGPAAPLTGKLSFRAKPPLLTATLTAPAQAKKLKLRLPNGLSIVKKRLAKGLKVSADGKRVKVKTSATQRTLTITLPAAAQKLKITLGSGALKRTRKLRSVKVKITATGPAGKSTALSLAAKAR